MQSYLEPTEFIDSQHPAVVSFAREIARAGDSDIGNAIALYSTIRDRIIYDPYVDYFNPRNYRASGVLAAGRGFCVGKAALLAATCRAIGIPARVGYADVRNHMTSPRLQQLIKTDVFIWHSYAELHLDGAWVKATPAFDSVLCARIGLAPLPFDGRTDSLFQEFDPQGRKHLEYLQDRGAFADVPFATITADLRIYYPALAAAARIDGDFHAEAQGSA